MTLYIRYSIKTVGIVWLCGACIMRLSMLCPTSPHPGLRGATMGNLICFESKTCPMGGVFEFRKCACAVVTCSYTEIYVVSLIPGSPIPGKRRDVDGWFNMFRMLEMEKQVVANPACYKWGFAVIYCPFDGEFELSLIPTSAPPTPGGGGGGGGGGGVVWHNIDRCISTVYMKGTKVLTLGAGR